MSDALPRPGASKQPGSAGRTLRRWAGRIDRLDEEQWDRRLLLALAALRHSGLTSPGKRRYIDDSNDLRAAMGEERFERGVGDGLPAGAGTPAARQ
jgi:hypothetical protein